MGKVMKVFKTLINELFGTKREYKVEGLGIFTCKVCDWWRDKCCLWSGAVQLPFYSVETLVLIEGDASAPFPGNYWNYRCYCRTGYLWQNN